MELYLIRHGQTEGNLSNLYVGRTDQLLTEKGIQVAQQCAQAGCFPQAERAYVTPLQRTQQTAAILFPAAEQIVVDDFIEMNFGDFEGKHSAELRGNPDYVSWVEAERIPSCPNGESGIEFSARVCDALTRLIADAFENGEERLFIVTHGGVGMTLMTRFARPELPFYRWWMPNCGGYRIVVEQVDWSAGVFSSWETVGPDLWRNRAYSFFQNVECEHFPCHETSRPTDFNCLFCFCPLYHLGADCGGDMAFAGQDVGRGDLQGGLRGGLQGGLRGGLQGGLWGGLQGGLWGGLQDVIQSTGLGAGQQGVRLGTKDCSACMLPHRRNSYGRITERLEACALLSK